MAAADTRVHAMTLLPTVHVALRASSPAAGDSLASPPRLLRLEFTEAVELSLSRLALIGPDSADVALSPIRTGDSASRSIAADVIGVMAAGEYRVRWSVVSGDGHPVRGEFRFTVLEARPEPLPDTVARAVEPPAAEPPAESAFDAQSPGYVAIRWLTYLGLLGVIGAVVFRVAVMGRMRRRASGEDATSAIAEALGVARTGAIVAAAVLIVAAGARLAAQMRAVYGDVPFDAGLVRGLLGGTAWGVGWMAQVAAAAAALGIAARARPRGRIADVAGVVVALVLAASAAISGHPVAAYPVGTAILADAVHLLAAGGWIGSLMLVVVTVVHLLRGPSPREDAVRDLVLAFSPVGLVCGGIILFTGAISAWLEMRSVAALWETPYGRTLLVKLGLVAMVAAAGAFNWRVATPRLRESGGTGRLRRAIFTEIGFAVAVLAATAVLVATPPPVDTVPVDATIEEHAGRTQ